MADFQSLINLLSVTADATSPASATYQVTTGVTGFAVFKTITILATVTGGTGGTLDAVIEHSPDGGVTWYEYWHIAQVAAVTAATYAYSPALNDSPVAVGKNNLTGSTLTTTITLGNGAVAGGHWFDMLRVKYVAGSGTSVGGAQNIKVLCVRESGLG
jgi:hypothetical protein